MGKILGKEIGTVRNSLQSFYFLRPAHNKDIMDIARKILDVNGVNEVHVTEGKYGLVVRASPDSGKERSPGAYIKRNFKERYVMLMSHYSYRK